MSATDSNPEAQMVTAAPSAAVSLPEAGRALAAIVFTDAANFSAMMSRDEVLTQRLVARDLAGMRLICESCGGQVVKSTGDGLLMLFGSAVQAVACGLEIQTRLREHNQLPSSERLYHRIGIHVGDVFRQHNDVMGDGVNIAARLQALGRPGWVCVSGTVFEVVRNRLPFHVVQRKQQKLKNVGKVMVYQLRPVGGAFDLAFKVWDFLRFNDARAVKIAIVVAIVIVGAYSGGKVKVSFWDRDPLHKYASQLSPLGRGVSDDSDDDSDDQVGRSSADGAYPAPGKIAKSEEDFFIERFDDMKDYNFTAMGDWLTKNDVPDRDTVKLQAVCVSMRHLMDWCGTNLRSYSESNPFLVRNDSGVVTYKFWPGTGNALTCEVPATSEILTGTQIPPRILARMAGQLLEQNGPTGDQGTALLRGLRYFETAYNVETTTDLEQMLKRMTEPQVKSPGNS